VSVQVHRAGRVAGQDIPYLTLTALEEIPSRAGTSKLMEEDAEAIADGLCESLPKGTLNRLVAEMLRRCAGEFIGARR